MMQVSVPVKSAWLAKINWVQVLGMAASGLALVTGNKYQVPGEVQAGIVTSIQGAASVVTWVMRTWFNGTVTPGSVTK